MLEYTRHAYTWEDYTLIKKHNRECLKLLREDDYGSIDLDNEFEPKYKLSINKKLYVMDNWVKGISELSKGYNINLRGFSSFFKLFKRGKYLPEEVDYAIQEEETGRATIYKYISKEYMFECYLNYESVKYVVYYGDIDKIKEIPLC